MRKITFSNTFAIVLCLLIIIGSLPVVSVFAQATEGVTEDGLQYVVEDNVVTIEGYKGDSSDIEIPSEIDGYPVTSIGDEVFVFTNISSITIPESVTSIGYGAFSYCYELTEIFIPKSVVSIGRSFVFASSIERIVVDADNPAYSSVDGVLFDKDIETLIVYPIKKTDISYKIPDSVKHIGEKAFQNCNVITQVGTAGTKIVAPLGANFNDIASVGGGFVAPDTYLQYLGLPEGLLTIGVEAFRGCVALKTFYVPESVYEIGNRVFDGCESLERIDVAEKNEHYASIDGVLYNKEITELITYPCCNKMTDYSIPDGITEIKSTAFQGRKNLNSVTIPDGITEIKSATFYECEKLNSITITSNVKSICNFAFYKCTNLTDVYYIGTEAQWDEISISDSGNNDLLNATIHFVNEIKDEDSDVVVLVGEEVELNVENLTDTQEFENVSAILTDGTVVSLYNITLFRDGAEVQPESKVIVKIPTDNLASKVYRVEVDGTLADMNAVYKNGYMVFTTEHFSLYVLALEKSAEEQRLLGDVNGDETVNIKDVTEIQKYVASLIELTEESLLAADFNRDEAVNIKDATMIQKKIAELID